MPKLRNHSTDTGKFTQWLGRKCRNHNPLEELSVVAKAHRPNIYKPKSKGELTMYGENTLIYTAGDRTFKIKVEDVSENEAVLDELNALSESNQLEVIGY